jgi:hypothetical protein
VIPSEENDDILSFKVKNQTVRQVANEDDGEQFEDCLLKPLRDKRLSPNDLHLTKNSTVIVHTGSRIAGGYMYIMTRNPEMRENE